MLTWEDCLRDRIWVTKTGERIKVEDMSYSHLENTIHMLMKKKMALSLGYDYLDKTEQQIEIVDVVLNMLRGEWRKRITAKENKENTEWGQEQC